MQCRSSGRILACAVLFLGLLAPVVLSQTCGNAGQAACSGIVQVTFSGVNCTGSRTGLVVEEQAPGTCKSATSKRALAPYTCGTSSSYGYQLFSEVGCKGFQTDDWYIGFGICNNQVDGSSWTYFCSTINGTARVPTPTAGPLLTRSTPSSTTQDCAAVDNCAAPIWKTSFSTADCAAANATGSRNLIPTNAKLDTCYEFVPSSGLHSNLKFIVQDGSYRVSQYSRGCSGIPDIRYDNYKLNYCYSDDSITSYMYRTSAPSPISAAQRSVDWNLLLSLAALVFVASVL